jgi:hypothetical protein
MNGPGSNFPHVFRVRQTFEGPQLDDLPAEVDSQLSRLNLAEKVRPGQSVAITAGSRGITGIRHIIKGVVDHLKRLKAEPFIVPAMGSHGGGTAEGQRRIVESHGITEAFCGCPIRASMDTVVVCRAAEGFEVHFDKHAHDADHVVVCNRVKPHTLFDGDIQSGLMKMMLIGLGKHAGARIYHRVIRDHSFGRVVRSVAGEVRAKCSILAGVAVVENSYGRTAVIEAVAPADFESREKDLLVAARTWLPRLPFDDVDVLLIDEVGKNISGAAVDLNVVGRKRLIHRAADDETPKVRMIAVRDLTDATYGNATGIGLVEFCRTRVLEKMDVKVTRINALTGGHFAEAMLPLDYPTDREMLEVMLTQIGLAEPPDAKMLWIRNTLALAEVACSSAYLAEARSRGDLEILSEPRPLEFDESGNLSDEHMNE